MVEALDPEANWLLLPPAGRAGGERPGLVDRVEMLIELTVGLAVVFHQSSGHHVAPGDSNAPKAG